MYFTRIPNESKIHFGIHMRYIKINERVQDTFWDTYEIHQDLQDVSCTWDTCAGYMRDTYEIHVSAEVRGYMRDTCGIHEGYIMRYMYLNCIQRGTYLQMYLVVS